MCSHLLLLPQKKHLKSILMKKHSERRNAEFIIVYYSYNDNTQTFLSTEQKESR